MLEINEVTARKVLEVVDAGLVKGIGRPEPGSMCVEAAVCYALELPFGDDPVCVSRALRELKITLNDSAWSSDQARAKGLRRLAIAQLGSASVLDDKEFAKRVVELAIRTCVPVALRAAAAIQPTEHHKGALLDAALLCEKEGTAAAAAEAAVAAWAAWAAADAAKAVAEAEAAAEAAAWAAREAAAAAARSAVRAAAWAAKDKSLSNFSEGVVQILIEMKAPGCQWLFLTEVK